MKILILTRYGQQGASSRMRFLQYQPWLIAAGFDCTVSPLFDDAMLVQKYQRGKYGYISLLFAYWRQIYALVRKNHFDLVWIEKEVLPWFPCWLERLLLRGKPYVLDFDDAIFHNYDLSRAAWIRFIYGQRIDRLMKNSRLVIAGNQYLASRAIKAGAQYVKLIPTVVDLDRYIPCKSYSASTKPHIVWIGSPSTAQYLFEIAESLSILATRLPFTLRIIGGGTISIDGVDIEVLPWSNTSEAAAIAECNVGIMPLRDTPWEQGKCAYKLIQYMACGLPTVSSPIGANLEVVIDNETGYFANTQNDWVEKMELLLRDSTLRQRLGQAGRARVQAKYCLQQTAPELIRLFTEVGEKNTCAV